MGNVHFCLELLTAESMQGGSGGLGETWEMKVTLFVNVERKRQLRNFERKEEEDKQAGIKREYSSMSLFYVGNLKWKPLMEHLI